MTVENDIIVAEDSYSISPRSAIDITAEQYGVLFKIAGIYAASVFSGSKNGGRVMSQNDAFIALMLGIELGFKPMSALQHISVIQGKPCLDGKGMMAVIHASGQLKDVKMQGDETKCTITMTRTNGISHTASFTIEEAKRAGLVKQGGGWEKYPARMLEWRCVAFCARFLFPDIIGGVYTPEEIADNVHVEDDGAMIIESTRKSPEELKLAMMNQLVEEGHYDSHDTIKQVVNGWREADLKSWKNPITEDDFNNLYLRLVENVTKNG